MIHRISIGSITLESGATIPDVVVAYTDFGKLSVAGDNAVLVTHGYTSGPAMLSPGPLTAEGAWDGLLQPGRALDPQRHYIICMNMLGSAYGTTGPRSINPATGSPWGPSFPNITLRDIVAVQHRALQQLGVRHLRAVVGPSYGGFQALQWALDYPDMLDAIGIVVAGLHAPAGLSAKGQRSMLANFPAWQDGWYGDTDMLEALAQLRLNTLQTYGLERWYQDQAYSPAACREQLQASSREWAEVFDANSLVTLAGAAESFDARSELSRIRARVLVMMSATDSIFPPDPSIPDLLTAAGVTDFRYRILDSPYGHLASGIEWQKIDSEIRWLLS